MRGRKSLRGKPATVDKKELTQVLGRKEKEKKEDSD
jgi:hypothetical protein